MPDTTYPTDDENWANCLSQVKKLSIHDGKLLQQPVETIKSLRRHAEKVSGKTIKENTTGQYELKLNISANQTGSYILLLTII